MILSGKTLPIIALMLVTGCVQGPNWRRPVMPVEPSWHTPLSTDEVDTRWWENFSDPKLSALIDEARECNYDVRMAKERLYQARAHRMVVGSRLTPQIDLEVNASKNTFGGALAGLGAALDEKSELYFWGFDALWELDLFGKRIRELEAARADTVAKQEELFDILLSVYAETALNYVEAVGYKARIENLQAWIKTVEEQQALVQEQLQFGIRSAVDLEEIREKLESLKSTLPLFEAELAANLYRLSVLTGKLPGLIETSDTLLSLPDVVRVGIPAELVLRRPDVRAAEAHYHVQMALLGAAEAELCPTLALTGNIGRQTFFFSTIDQVNLPVWGLTVDILAPVFHGGRIRGNIAEKAAAMREACLAYYRDALRAMEEAESGMARYVKGREETERLGLALSASRGREALITERMRGGVASGLEALEAQERAFRARAELIDGHVATLAKLVALYKALGGGWEG